MYRNFKLRAYEGRDNEEQLTESLKDKLAALTTIYASQPNATSIMDLGYYIDDLFSDEESPITLSTVHRAKGLEGDRIFIIKPEDMPMIWESQKKWQKNQEDNLLYVALTRSKRELYIVGKPDWFEPEPEPESESESEPKEDKALVSRNNSESESTCKPLTNLDLVMEEISQFSYEERCELLNLLKQKVDREKWDRTSKYLIENLDQSDRSIARECGVSAPFVARVRKKLQI